MLNFKKGIAIFALSFLALTAFVAVPDVSANSRDSLGFDYVDDADLLTNEEIEDPRVMAVNIVRFFMTFLGIIAVVIILLGGFKWMTAAGNEDKVAEAKKLLVAGIIGLAIIISAYVIVNFVVETTDTLISEGDITYD